MLSFWMFFLFFFFQYHILIWMKEKWKCLKLLKPHDLTSSIWSQRKMRSHTTDAYFHTREFVNPNNDFYPPIQSTKTKICKWTAHKNFFIDLKTWVGPAAVFGWTGKRKMVTNSATYFRTEFLVFLTVKPVT